MDTLANLQRKLNGAKEIKSVVRTMKAMAASNIGQYELAVSSLSEYYHTISLGIIAYFDQEQKKVIIEKKHSKKDKVIYAIVFGSDQGLVGQFNDSLSDFVSKSLNAIQGKKEIWAVGERVQLLLSDAGFSTTKFFLLPNSVIAITPLVQQILMKSVEIDKKEVHIYHNKPEAGAGYIAVGQRLLPLDKKWELSFADLHWPTKIIPQIIEGVKPILLALIHEYLFVSLFKACAESLASENASRLAAMQRAEKNIEGLLDNLGHQFHSLRQSTIDEELFDVVSGFEALKNKASKK